MHLENQKNQSANKSLPDVTLQQSSVLGLDESPLEWVGMQGIELPIKFNKVLTAAKIDAMVSLDKKPSRGIHMSRLYLLVQKTLAEENLSFDSLIDLTQNFLSSHEELSSRAQIAVTFDAPILRPALKSDHQGWRTYPVKMGVIQSEEQIQKWMEVVVTYSSTCPASAALSRRLIQENFEHHFVKQELHFDKIYQWLGSSDGIVATPHAQRSYAKVKVNVEDFDFVSLINLVEEALKTPVQGAVKREDEQEFALLNGQNLMFCEDAARRVRVSLEKEARIIDYVGEFNHQESLHPHNAVSYIKKLK